MIGFIEDKAYVLHRIKHRETSQKLHLFSLESGHIQAVLKGVYTQRKYRCATQPFTLLNIRYKNTRYPYRYLSVAEPVISPRHHFTGQRIACALYINEILFHSLPYQHAYQELFYLYAQFLAALEQACLDLLDIQLRIFEKQMLSLLGYHYNFTLTCHDAAVAPHKMYHFIPGQGLIDAAHAKHATTYTRHDGYSISQSISQSAGQAFTGEALLAMAHNDFTEKATRQQAKYIMRAAIQHMIGYKTLKSRKLFVDRNFYTWLS